MSIPEEEFYKQLESGDDDLTAVPVGAHSAVSRPWWWGFWYKSAGEAGDQ